MDGVLSMSWRQPRTEVILPPEPALTGSRRAGRIAATVLDLIGLQLRAGMTTAQIDRRCHALIRAAEAIPAPLGYKGYPAATCISVNEEVCHGLPGERALRDGDIVNIDICVRVDGWHGDTSRMFFIGTPPLPARRLCQVTFEAMWRGIRAARRGARIGDIGHAIQTHAEAHGCAVVRDYCGHGIGRAFHQPPLVPHVGPPNQGQRLETGMVLTIEPMLNAGGAEVELAADGWTVLTRDRRLSAQFEHMVLIGPTGPEVLTLSPSGMHHPPW